jgi:predicted nucleic acid-binding protein
MIHSFTWMFLVSTVLAVDWTTEKSIALSMASDVFVDSSGLYALADRRDSYHRQARDYVKRLLESGRRLVLTDYVIDESCTLAKIRAGGDAALRLLEIVERSRAFQVRWIGAEYFDAVKAFFRRHLDHGYSFTDCASFVVMQEMGLSKALTTDRHFTEAGFRALLRVR